MKNKGLTLIEIVISIAIVAVAFYSVINVFSIVTYKNVGSEQVLTASFLAEQTMEEFIAEGRDWDTDIVSRPIQSYSGEFSNFSNTVTVTEVDLSNLNGVSAFPPTDYKRIEVEVTSSLLDVPVKIVTFVINKEIDE